MWNAWLPPVAYVAMIFYLSSIPALTPPAKFDHADKLAHFLEYGGLGILLFRAAWLSWRPRVSRPAWVLTVGGGALIACLDEVFQGTVGRSRSPWDWAADVCGLAAAALVASRLATSSRVLGGKRTTGNRPEAAGNPER